MKNSGRIRVALLAFLLVGLILGVTQTVLANAGTVTGDKTLSPTEIQCGGSTMVTLTLTGVAGIAGEPEDIMLVLDRSGSMSGTPLANLKIAAKAFVDIIDEGTDGALDGVISHGSRVGVVSFADSAIVNVALTTDANAVKAAIDALVAGGNTNHEAAISLANTTLWGSLPTHSKVMIIFTDGRTTAGGDPDDDAAAARSAGVEIFAIGLGDVNVGQLNDWATDPDAEHVFIAPTSDDLEEIFEKIGAAIVVPAATGITVMDTVSDHFSVSGASATKGTVTQVGNVLTWTIDKLFTETVTLTYTATHDSTKPGGIETVDTSVTYSDDQGQVVTFPNPTVNVIGCPEIIKKESKCTGWGLLGPKANPSAKFKIWAYSEFLPKGVVEYRDNVKKLDIKSTQITQVSSTSDLKKCTITGLAEVTGVPDSNHPFTVTVEDNADPGKDQDKFEISVPDIGYSNSGVLSFGDIEIEK